MKILRLLAPSLLLLSVAGCGGSPNSKLPDARGTWTLNFTPSTLSGSATPSSTSMTVTFSQDGASLSGKVENINNPPTGCFPGISSSTPSTVVGRVNAPGEAIPANFTLTITFTPTAGGGTNAISVIGGISPTGGNGLYTFNGTAPSGCFGTGTYTIAKAS